MLIANRGEIAVRIIQSAKEMGIRTIAVFSDPDRLSLHVRRADVAVNIGNAPANESYLNMKKIIEVAKELNADAIHPGYGFLSENAVFAEMVNSNGIIFVGPSPSSIATMGDKISAKKAVQKDDVPLVPGTAHAVQSLEEARNEAQKIGYPILLKATAGGGGKGMRIVHQEADLEESLQRASSEANSAFGNADVFIEKYITSPRHIEFQILADHHGNTIHLFERECSIQRRHQKVLEEAPSTLLDNQLRHEMGKAAIAVAKSCDYVGAGTVEFIMDDQRNFYFLEMNTRLQVEHPITELITGIDLVKEQLKIAMNMPLSVNQEDLKINGHAIELRVYAEDPANNFLPDSGVINYYEIPTGPGIRIDNGVYQGCEVSTYYDPMLAKIACWAASRKEVISRLKLALSDYHISGIHTTVPFGSFVLNHAAFVNGEYDTHFTENFFVNPDQNYDNEDDAAAFVAHLNA